ncbi:MAG: sulfite exporter TauE/SafE family protein [Thalassotalea sp.]
MTTALNPMRLSNPRFLIIFIGTWLMMLTFAPMALANMLEYMVFCFLGMAGATFANATGAGGGVIFIPFFNQLEFTEQQAIGTSIAIQCFGMTSGALTWWFHYRQQKTDLILWQGFKRIIAITSVTSILGIWFVYGKNLQAGTSLSHSFSWFSLILGAAIIVMVVWVKPQRERSKILVVDWLAFLLIGFSGGVVTAWLSVGVGELLAIYLIIRRFDVTMAVAAAVVVSAVTVWSAIWQHTLVEFNVYWQVVLFAGPGAILGGVIAKTLVTHLSARRLKVFFAFWLVVTGSLGIFG